MKKIFLSFFFFTLFSQNVFALENLWYYTETPRSRESFFKNANKINVLAPQTYELKEGGIVSSNMKNDILEFASRNNVKVMPLLANTDGKIFNQKTIKNLLDDTKNWQAVSKYMREEAYNKNYIGWQLDLENIPVSYKDKFNNFVKYLNGEFKKDNLILSVAVVSKVSDEKKEYDANYWNNWAGAYDYKFLSDNTDFLSIMAYDEPASIGPVASLSWSKKVLDYATSNIQPEKISFGIPVYGWAYRGKEKKHFSMVDYPFTYKILTDFNKNDSNNMTTGAGISKNFGNISWVSYNKFGKNYTIWYEDKNSFETKLNQIKKYAPKVRGISVWVLGDEDPQIWKLKF